MNAKSIFNMTITILLILFFIFFFVWVYKGVRKQGSLQATGQSYTVVSSFSGLSRK